LALAALAVRQKRLEALALETTEQAVVLQVSEHSFEDPVAFSDLLVLLRQEAPQAVAQLLLFLMFMVRRHLAEATEEPQVELLPVLLAHFKELLPKVAEVAPVH
jgi:hypothetical protein